MARSRSFNNNLSKADTLAGFDLTIHNYESEDDTTRPELKHHFLAILFVSKQFHVSLFLKVCIHTGQFFLHVQFIYRHIRIPTYVHACVIKPTKK
jgi:hypothetical protein